MLLVTSNMYVVLKDSWRWPAKEVFSLSAASHTQTKPKLNRLKSFPAAGKGELGEGHFSGPCWEIHHHKGQGGMQ